MAIKHNLDDIDCQSLCNKDADCEIVILYNLQYGLNSNIWRNLWLLVIEVSAQETCGLR